MRVGLISVQLVLLGIVAVFFLPGGGAVGGEAELVLADNPDYYEIILTARPKRNRAHDAGQGVGLPITHSAALATATLRPVLHACADGLARLPRKTRLRVELTAISLMPEQDDGAVGRLVGTARLEDIATGAIIGDLGVIDVQRRPKHSLCNIYRKIAAASRGSRLSAQDRLRILSLSFVAQINTIIGRYF